ncbi:TVP38/TMEM64 family protein [Enterococcus alcedinis]|uniref:TVP38/TMEM64 family membrane protein n=1 Tax=Enterococcus alcedinis TaxID=1274384 RepID=A0A917N4R8_9ENTE|nr:TVP38/TMEM64 family protein [Enterococcus alcedinis]MBP2102370.1 putative membrane protein YdjX (TVP38/TMEM64 family) [Enterococcus alcedinis]GGI65928.1 TVP38/TMEM64 family protein [Enterococcus alcedinis]
MNAITSKRIINLISLIGMAFSIALTVYFFSIGLFDDLNALQNLVGEKLLLGPIIFILIQILQVVIPIIPGGISTAAGVLLFGPVAGFFYNYIGIVIGSILVFLLGRQYGKPFVLSLISEKTYEKYIVWFDNQGRFNKLFALAIFFPFAPDDALCLMAGLTNMSLKTFSWIILLGKPASILVYSSALVYGTNLISQFL